MADQFVMMCNVRLKRCISVKLINHLSIQNSFDLSCDFTSTKAAFSERLHYRLTYLHITYDSKVFDWAGYCFNGTRPLFSALIGPLCPN